MNGVYYVIRHMPSQTHIGPPGVSRAPHLYLTPGKAEGIRKQMHQKHDYEVIPVQLTEIEGTKS